MYLLYCMHFETRANLSNMRSAFQRCSVHRFARLQTAREQFGMSLLHVSLVGAHG